MIIKRFFGCLVISVTLFNMSCPASTSHGIFEDSGDVGAVAIPGSAQYDPENQEYLIQGSGVNMWFSEDEISVFVQKDE